MHTEKREDPLVEMGYEIRDIDMPKIKKAVYYFFAFAIFCIIAAWFSLFGTPWGTPKLFGVVPLGFEGMNPMYARKDSGFNVVRRTPAPPNPILQTNVTAKTDMFKMRQEEDKRLNGTGYVDGNPNRAHIPIDRAIDLLVERGIGKAKGDSTAASRGTTDGKMNVDTTEPYDQALERMNRTEAAAGAIR